MPHRILVDREILEAQMGCTSLTLVITVEQPRSVGIEAIPRNRPFLVWSRRVPIVGGRSNGPWP